MGGLGRDMRNSVLVKVWRRPDEYLAKSGKGAARSPRGDIQRDPRPGAADREGPKTW